MQGVRPLIIVLFKWQVYFEGQHGKIKWKQKYLIPKIYCFTHVPDEHNEYKGKYLKKKAIQNRDVGACNLFRKAQGIDRTSEQQDLFLATLHAALLPQ